MQLPSNHKFPLEAVIFDLGNTLIYFDTDWPSVAPQANAALLSALRQSGIQLPETDFVAEIDQRMNAYYRQREAELTEYTFGSILQDLLVEKGFKRLPDEQLKFILRARFAISQVHWQVETDAAQTLDALRQQGYRLAIISNASDDDDVQTLIDRAGLRPFFEIILTSAAAGIRKPHPAIFRAVLDQLGLPAQRTVMVGDTLGADILGAQAVGMRAVWITRRADRGANRTLEAAIQPDAVVETLSQLPEILATWNHQID